MTTVCICLGQPGANPCLQPMTAEDLLCDKCRKECKSDPRVRFATLS